MKMETNRHCAGFPRSRRISEETEPRETAGLLMTLLLFLLIPLLLALSLPAYLRYLNN